MSRKSFLLGFVTLLALNVGLMWSQPVPAAAQGDDVWSCACYGGTGKEPIEPGEPFCESYLVDDCDVASECEC